MDGLIIAQNDHLVIRACRPSYTEFGSRQAPLQNGLLTFSSPTGEGMGVFRTSRALNAKLLVCPFEHMGNAQRVCLS